MSRKHFIALAKAINGIADDEERKRMARLIGEVCRECNSNLKWSHWNHACNVPAGS